MTKKTISEKQAYAMAQVCLDLHDALGCKWGDNPYLTISQLKAAAQPAPMQEPVAWMQEDGEHFSIWKDKYATVPLYTTPPAPQPDYAWPTIEDYEKEVGFEVNIAFRSAWAMARTTNDLFNQMGETK